MLPNWPILSPEYAVPVAQLAATGGADTMALIPRGAQVRLLSFCALLCIASFRDVYLAFGASVRCFVTPFALIV
jgi:hypothetical protein